MKRRTALLSLAGLAGCSSISSSPVVRDGSPTPAPGESIRVQEQGVRPEFVQIGAGFAPAFKINISNDSERLVFVGDFEIQWFSGDTLLNTTIHTPGAIPSDSVYHYYASPVLPFEQSPTSATLNSENSFANFSETPTDVAVVSSEYSIQDRESTFIEQLSTVYGEAVIRNESDSTSEVGASVFLYDGDDRLVYSGYGADSLPAGTQFGVDVRWRSRLASSIERISATPYSPPNSTWL